MSTILLKVLQTESGMETPATSNRSNIESLTLWKLKVLHSRYKLCDARPNPITELCHCLSCGAYKLLHSPQLDVEYKYNL